MMIKPMKTLELHYPMIQFLITSDIPRFLLGNIRSRDAFRPIAGKQKDFMDYKLGYLALLYGSVSQGLGATKLTNLIGSNGY